MQKPPSALKGIGYMVSAMACFAVMNTAIRGLAPSMDSMQMVFLRNCLSLILIIMWMVATDRRLPNLGTQRLNSHLWRAATGFFAMELWFFSVTLMPVTLAVAISFTTPIFGALIAILFLGEKAGWRRWGAIALGFCGVLVMLNPWEAGLPHSALVVLFSSAMMGIAGTLVKSLARTERPEVIVLYMAFFMTVFSSLTLIAVDWKPVGTHEAQLILIIAVFSTAAQLFMARAFQYADVVVLMPFDFTRLVFVAILAYFFFGETLTRDILIGAAVIVMSSVYIAHREARHARGPKGAVPLPD